MDVLLSSRLDQLSHTDIARDSSPVFGSWFHCEETCTTNLHREEKVLSAKFPFWHEDGQVLACVGCWVAGWVDGWGHIKSLKLNKVGLCQITNN